MDAKSFLTDEFIEFSKEVEKLHLRKKELENEMKEYYAGYKSRVDALDEEVALALEKWESRKTK